MFLFLLKIIILSVSIVTFLLGIIVLKRKLHSTVNITFFILSTTISLWAFLNFILTIYPSLSLMRVIYAMGPLGVSAWWVFTLVFCQKRVWYIFLPYLFGLLFSSISLSSFVIKELNSFSVFGSEIIYGKLFPLFSFYMLIVASITIRVLFSSYRIEKGRKRNQIRFIFLGTGIFCFLIILVSFILPLLNITKFLMFDSPSSIFFIGFIAYAIAKHRLMDVRLLVLKSMAYSMTLVVIAAAYSMVALVIAHQYILHENQDVFNITVILVAIVGFNPLRKFIEKYTDNIFAKGRYDLSELLRKLSNITSKNVILDELTYSIMEILMSEMRITRVAMVLTHKDSLSDIKEIGFGKIQQTLWEKAIKMIENKKMLVEDEIIEFSWKKKLFSMLKAEVIIALRTEGNEGKIVGILVLGGKRSGEMFSYQDLKLFEIIAPQIAISIQNANLLKVREKRISELDSLNKLALSLGSTLELDNILEDVLEQALCVTGGETGSIMLVDEVGHSLSIKCSRGIPEDVASKTKLSIGEGIAGWVTEKNHPLKIVNGQHDNKYLDSCLKRDDISSALAVPLTVREKVIGVLSVSRKKVKDVYTNEDLNLISSFAAQAAGAIENARLFKKSERQFLETIMTLAGAVDAKDHYTFGHSEAVTKYARVIAKEMGLSRNEVRDIEIGGRLHDIGKIGIPERILNKPTSLSDSELDIIKKHPKIAVDILKSALSLKDIIPFILFHHERLDGKGYPTGLAGKNIPLGARIIAVADAWNAMRSNRPYRNAFSVERTIEEIKKNSGSQFDPNVVETFLSIIDKRKKEIHLKVI